MKRSTLDRLLEARAGKRPVAHLRWLKDGGEALVVAGESTPVEKELVAFVKGFVDSGRLTRHALMLKVLVVDEIAKTSVGKIDKKLLRQKHL